MKNINYEQAKCIMQNYSAVLIDVRVKEEYETKHFPGAISIPLNEFERNVKSIIPNKNKILIVYCRSGVRSLQAVEILENMGYKNVYNLMNGILGLRGKKIF